MGEPKVVVEFKDKLGDKRVIRRTRHGLQLKRNESTVCCQLAQAIGPMIGKKIREARIASGLTLAGLCHRAGIVSSTPKSRMYEIECGVRNLGIRLGTIYAIAIALGKEVTDFLPTVDEVRGSVKCDIKPQDERLVLL